MNEDVNDIINLLQELGFTCKGSYPEYGEAPAQHIFYEKGRVWMQIIVSPSEE